MPGNPGGIWFKLSGAWVEADYIPITYNGGFRQGYQVWYRRNGNWLHAQSGWTGRSSTDGVGVNDIYMRQTSNYRKPGDLLTETHTDWLRVNPPPGEPQPPDEFRYYAKMSRPQQAAPMTVADLPFSVMQFDAVARGEWSGTIGTAEPVTMAEAQEALSPLGIVLDFWEQWP